MQKITAVAGLLMMSAFAQAGETLDADAVRKLITGNTVHGLSPTGVTQKNYFGPDGKTIRQTGDKIVEGSWSVNDDGTQCVKGMPGGCAKIVDNGNGTYDRVTDTDGIRLRWTSVVKGKDF